MKHFQRFWAFSLFAVLMVSGLIVVPVSAHALFLRSQPAANAVLTRSPALVELFFSEALEPGLSSITVLDSDAKVVDQQDVRVDPNNPTHMSVSLRSLVDGVYTVSWKAISATDGHLTNGSFPFAIGFGQAASLSTVRPEQKQIPLSTGGLVIQWLLVVVLAILCGRLPFQSWIWWPVFNTGSQNPGITDPPAWQRLLHLSLLGLYLLLGADFLFQVGQATGGLTFKGFAASAGQILLETRLGLIWLIRLALALLCGWLFFSRPTQWKAWSTFGIALLLLFTLSLTSHAAAEPHPFFPILADWLHMLSVSLWIGGLTYFVTGVAWLRQQDGLEPTRLTALLIPRFSALAITCVGLSGVTGLYSAVLRIGAIPAVFGTLYGRVLLLKLALATPLLLLGAVNLLILSPRLRQARLQLRENEGSGANPVLVRRFGQVILAEMVLGALVLLSASLLGALPPVVTASTTTDQDHTLNVDDLNEELTISPGRVGLNTFTLRLQSAGQPVELTKEVVLRFSAIQHNLPPSEVQLVSKGNGVYLANGGYLSLPGAWQIQIIVRRENQFDVFANLNLNFQNPNAGSPSLENAHIAGGLLLIIGVAYGLLILALIRSPGLRLGLGGVPLFGLVTFSVLFLTRPLPSNQGLVNPIPPSSASVSAGQNLFAARCAGCHGLTGKGDGPAGLAMRPRPADLTQHAIPGVHTDAQLFQWISQGYPGTQMPAFRSILSDTDRWNLVNFIRTFAPR
jgi:copper transport protein